jgi:hypothetical protein
MDQEKREEDAGAPRAPRTDRKAVMIAVSLVLGLALLIALNMNRPGARWAR